MEFSSQTSGFICIALGLSFGAYFFWTLIRLRASKGWLKTAATILESGLEEDSDGWRPVLLYSYTVKQKQYTSDQLYLYTCNSVSEREASKQLDPYPAGKTVTAYYNPSNPQEAVLNNHVPLWRHVFWVFFSGFLLFVGLAFLGESG